MGFFTSIFGGDEEQTQQTAVPQTPYIAPQDTLQNLITLNLAMIRKTNSLGDVLPTSATMLARRITDLLKLILTHDKAANLGSYDKSDILSLLTDYMPTALDTYAQAARNNDIDPNVINNQLIVLINMLNDIYGRMAHDDNQAMQVQAVFMESKFARSELDIFK